MTNQQQDKHFYIFDYFLDGYFLKWEEVEANFPVYGQQWVVRNEDGTQIITKVIGTEQISENEHRIFLCS